jgi:hypothetical protein
MKRSGVSPEEVAAKQGVLVPTLWEWYSKGTRLVILCSAGESLVNTQ